MKSVFSMLFLTFLFCQQSLAIQDFKLDIDVTEKDSFYYLAKVQFTEKKSATNNYTFSLPEEVSAFSGESTTVTKVIVGGKKASFTYKEGQLVIRSADLPSERVSFEIQYKIPSSNKSPIQYPIGLSYGPEFDPHVVYIGEPGFLFPTMMKIGQATAEPLNQGVIRVKVPSKWQFWSNLKRVSVTGNIHEYEFDMKNTSQMAMFSFLTAPKIYVHNVKGAQFFKKIVSYTSIDSNFIKLSDRFIAKMEDSVIEKYGPLSEQKVEGAIVWYPDSYFIGRSRGHVVHMSPQMYENEEYYAGEETLAHEIFHLLFGYKLWIDYNKAICDRWLIEGWTSFQAMIFMGEQNKDEYFRDLVRRNADRVGQEKQSVCSDPYAAGALMHVYLSQQIGLENYYRKTKEFLSLGEFRNVDSDQWLNFLAKSYPTKIDPVQVKKILQLKGSKFWQQNLNESRN